MEGKSLGKALWLSLFLFHGSCVHSPDWDTLCGNWCLNDYNLEWLDPLGLLYRGVFQCPVCCECGSNSLAASWMVLHHRHPLSNQAGLLGWPSAHISSFFKHFFPRILGRDLGGTGIRLGATEIGHGCSVLRDMFTDGCWSNGKRWEFTINETWGSVILVSLILSVPLQLVISVQ